jgi:hypothetical protein
MKEKRKERKGMKKIPIEDFWALENAIPKSVQKILVRIMPENTI